jgi:hypothetical protein
MESNACGDMPSYKGVLRLQNEQVEVLIDQETFDAYLHAYLVQQGMDTRSEEGNTARAQQQREQAEQALMNPEYWLALPDPKIRIIQRSLSTPQRQWGAEAQKGAHEHFARKGEQKMPQEPPAMSTLTTEQILEVMSGIEERWDSLQTEIVSRVRDRPSGTAALAHLETEAILAEMEECQKAWDRWQEEIIVRAKRWDAHHKSVTS